MPELLLPPDSQTTEEQEPRYLEQVIHAVLGTVGKGIRFRLTALADAANWALELRNRTAPGKALRARNSGDTLSLLEVDDNGVRVGVPLETSDNLVLGPGSDVASASSVTLPAGVRFRITGTTTIDTIAAKAANSLVVLRFASANCRVTDRNTSGSGNVYLSRRHLYSDVNGQLILLSDGTNWHEVSRSNSPVYVTRMVANTTDTDVGQTIQHNTTTSVEWNAAHVEFPDDRSQRDANLTTIHLNRYGRYLVAWCIVFQGAGTVTKVRSNLERDPNSGNFEAYGDGMELLGNGGANETSSVGAQVVWSDGNYKIRVRVLQLEGGDITLSGQNYETFCNVIHLDN